MGAMVWRTIGGILIGIADALAATQAYRAGGGEPFGAAMIFYVGSFWLAIFAACAGVFFGIVRSKRPKKLR